MNELECRYYLDGKCHRMTFCICNGEQGRFDQAADAGDEAGMRAVEVEANRRVREGVRP